MIVYSTFLFFATQFFGSIFFATTCGTNTGHVTRTNYYKLKEALLTTYSCELEKAFPNCCVRTLLPAKGLPECSGTVTNSLFMSLFVCLLDVIFVAATISAAYMTTCGYIGFGPIQRLVNPYFNIICHYYLTLYVTRSVVLRWKESRGLSTYMT